MSESADSTGIWYTFILNRSNIINLQVDDAEKIWENATYFPYNGLPWGYYP